MATTDAKRSGTTRHPPNGRRPASLSDNKLAILEGVYQHRMLTTAQVRALYKPDTLPRATEVTLKELRECVPPLLRTVATPYRTHSVNLHFLTAHGIKIVRSGKFLEPRKQFSVPLTPELAGGALQPHSIGVNDVGIAFVEAARARGDGCGPLDWRHEVSHVISPSRGRGGRDGETVRADALLRYTLRRDGQVFPLARFIEFDRATMGAVDLAAKARSYARLWAYRPDGSSEPGWKKTYTWDFPEVLIVLAGLRRTELVERMHDVLAFIRADPEVQRVPVLVVSCVLLSDLQQQGPFAKVLHRHDMPGVAVDWLGED